MPFDTPEQALLFAIKCAVRSFNYAPPRKNQTGAMSDWQELLAEHMMEHLHRCGWEFKQKEAHIAPGPANMPKLEGS
jgi:hypothetical protein